MNLSGISLSSIRGQFDTFLMADYIHFVRFVCFLTFLIFCLFGVILSLLGPYRAIFVAGLRPEKLFGVYSLRLIPFILKDFLVF